MLDLAEINWQFTTTMSRFIEILNSHCGEIKMRTLPVILKELKTGIDAETAHIEVKFPYFVEREAPVTKSKALMNYDCTFIGESNGTKNDFLLRVRVPVTSLCPCSKEISDYGDIISAAILLRNLPKLHIIVIALTASVFLLKFH